MITRAVPLDEEQFLFIEGLGKDFIRVGDQDTATKLLAIALAWKVSRDVPEPLENDRDFRCWIDESGGLAEVVELAGYSRKAPCA